MSSIQSIKTNTEVGTPVPIVVGEIVSFKPQAEKDGVNKQNIKIKDSAGDEIRMLLKDRYEITQDHVGKTFSFECKKMPKGLADGISLKATDKNELYLLATKNAIFTEVKESQPIVKQEKKEVKEESQPDHQAEQEQPSEVDKIIKKEFLSRNYIYQYLLALNEEVENKYPKDKLPELATSISINLERKCVDVLPKKKVLKFEQKKQSAPTERVEWRKVPHFDPEAKGKLLGSYTEKDIIDKFSKAYFKNVDKIDSFFPEKLSFFKAVGVALAEFKYGIARAIASEMIAINPSLKVESVAMQRLTKYFRANGKDDADVGQDTLYDFIKDKSALTKAANGEY